MLKSESLLSLFAQSRLFKEQWEQFALVALYKRATVSESFFLSQKTSDWREKPMSEVLTLVVTLPIQ